MINIAANDDRLVYSGRIDWADELRPVMIFSACFVRLKFRGSKLAVVMRNKHAYWENRMGLIVDGVQSSILLSDSEDEIKYTLYDKSIGNADCDSASDIHEVLLFKRMDTCHSVAICGFEMDDEAELFQANPLPKRKIEVFGDSVSCGEVAEALDYIGKVDPEHNGEYSNCWCAYSWFLARKLNATLHNTSQGGIALLDNTGWYHEPEYPGLESCYNKININPDLGELTEWDFSRYTPSVVIFAFGQNDSHPVDYMKEDYNCDSSIRWRDGYKAFLEKLMDIYPKATFILTTTILEHDASWDRAIDEVMRRVIAENSDAKSRVHHFLYSKNGVGTPGHVRTPEAEEMAEELGSFIESLGEEIWEN